MIRPRQLLRIEGAVFFAAACILYQQSNGSWLWFCLLFFTPDFSMLGYLANKRVGATVYNVGHTYTAPLLLLLALWLLGQTVYMWVPLVWWGHIGFDRLVGYGLKYETAFKDTHLQRV